MNLYREYKPFRNYLHRLDLISALQDIWQYSVHIMDDQPLPTTHAIGRNALMSGSIKHQLYPWDLDILSKEVVLNAGKGGDRSLRNWNHLWVAVQHLRRLENVAFDPEGEGPDVLFELHRLFHRQVPWQQKMGVPDMMRGLKVFGAAAVEEIVLRDLGMTTTQFFQLGAAITGHFFKKPGMSTNQDYSKLGIPLEASRAFLARITCTLDQLRSDIAKRQSYDCDWLYTWNPLEATPLISFDPEYPDRVYCPIPCYVQRRASAGIFYDLVNSKGFDNHYGASFEAYVGEVINVVCKPPRFVVRGEEPYLIGGKKFHGVDWVLSDNTGHLFIESKTKRITLNAKTHSDPAAVDADLLVMATAVVQNYENIQRALDGKTSWKADGLPIYPLVLTIEDWFIFSPTINDMLAANIRRLLGEANISERVLEDMPYTIASAHEFEIANQIIAQVGIGPLWTAKLAKGQRGWSLLPSIRENFPEELSKVNWLLFADDWAKLTPSIKA